MIFVKMINFSIYRYFKRMKKKLTNCCENVKIYNEKLKNIS